MSQADREKQYWEDYDTLVHYASTDADFQAANRAEILSAWFRFIRYPYLTREDFCAVFNGLVLTGEMLWDIMKYSQTLKL